MSFFFTSICCCVICDDPMAPVRYSITLDLFLVVYEIRLMINFFFPFDVQSVSFPIDESFTVNEIKENHPCVDSSVILPPLLQVSPLYPSFPLHFSFPTAFIPSSISSALSFSFLFFFSPFGLYMY